MHHGSRASGSSPAGPAGGLELSGLHFGPLPPGLCEPWCPSPQQYTASRIGKWQRYTPNQYQYETHNRLLADSVLWLFSGLKVEKTKHCLKPFYSRKQNGFYFRLKFIWTPVLVSMEFLYCSTCIIGLMIFFSWKNKNICKVLKSFKKTLMILLWGCILKDLWACMHRIIWR